MTVKNPKLLVDLNIKLPIICANDDFTLVCSKFITMVHIIKIKIKSIESIQATTPQVLQSQNYNICFRQEEGKI